MDERFERDAYECVGEVLSRRSDRFRVAQSARRRNPQKSCRLSFYFPALARQQHGARDRMLIDALREVIATANATTARVRLLARAGFAAIARSPSTRRVMASTRSSKPEKDLRQAEPIYRIGAS